MRKFYKLLIILIFGVFVYLNFISCKIAIKSFKVKSEKTQELIVSILNEKYPFTLFTPLVKSLSIDSEYLNELKDSYSNDFNTYVYNVKTDNFFLIATLVFLFLFLPILKYNRLKRVIFFQLFIIILNRFQLFYMLTNYNNWELDISFDETFLISSLAVTLLSVILLFILFIKFSFHREKKTSQALIED